MYSVTAGVCPIDESAGGNVKRQLLAVSGALGLVFAMAFGPGPAGAAPGGGDTAGRTLLVFNHDARSASAHDGAKGSGCGNAAYSTIGAAVAAASPGDTIKVCPGTYPEDVAVDKALTLTGQNATIDATGKDNGVQVLASGVTVQGFTVMNAIGEGILVGQTPLPQGVTPLDIGDVTIQDNIVVDNDQGNPTGQELTASSYAQCVAANNIPGDCGEGIHLLSVHSSTVTGNYVSGDSGGILLTDENGATYGNTISSNTVSNNLYDCGITIAGHRPLVFGGGVHDNTISGNRATGNGVLGQGGGVLLASGVPGNIPGIPGTGGAVYDNTVTGNFLAGNGLAGVTVHSHSPGENLNGNVVENNVIGTNNLDFDEDFSPFVDPSTTGVIVASVAPLSITIANNAISDNFYGIWLMPAVTATGTSTNTFVNVTIRVGP
jgi:parallel beta-helix repeat protein